jgi:DSF synthase
MSELAASGRQEFRISDRYSVAFDERYGILTSSWGPAGQPCFSRELLANMHSGISTIEDGNYEHAVALRYFVLRSEFPAIFSLGGDLTLFSELIQKRDHEGLRSYGSIAIHLMRALSRGLNGAATTLALVQGKCYGGGFEVALACDYVIAEQQAEFCFPEITLGIFPGMGAVSVLARRAEKRIFEELLHSGRRVRASELFEMGIVDRVVEQGGGENAVMEFVKARHSNFRAHHAMTKTRRNVYAISEQEAADVLEQWIECALALDRRRLLILNQVAAQQRTNPE